MVGTGIIGHLMAYAIPFAKLKPTRSPVNDPGPILTAMASINLI